MIHLFPSDLLTVPPGFSEGMDFSPEGGGEPVPSAPSPQVVDISELLSGGAMPWGSSQEEEGEGEGEGEESEEENTEGVSDVCRQLSNQLFQHQLYSIFGLSYS